MKYESSILIYITDIISNVTPIKMEPSYFMTDIALRVNEELQIQRLLDQIHFLLLFLIWCLSTKGFDPGAKTFKHISYWQTDTFLEVEFGCW